MEAGWIVVLVLILFVIEALACGVVVCWFCFRPGWRAAERTPGRMANQVMVVTSPGGGERLTDDADSSGKAAQMDLKKKKPAKPPLPRRARRLDYDQVPDYDIPTVIPTPVPGERGRTNISGPHGGMYPLLTEQVPPLTPGWNAQDGPQVMTSPSAPCEEV